MAADMAQDFRWEEAKRLFDAALALDPPARDAYLREACRGEPDLLDEVQSLVAWHHESTGFLETPAAQVSALPMPILPGSLVGQSLGAWRITDVIGRGGMGVVYRAERADDAFQREAAIKVVGSGGDVAPILDRFRLERATLAALDHPNIARLMDGGTTPGGQPYFVMELVDGGVPVDRYCDDHHLSIDRRLDLFRTICSGVQYAHERLIVHRDIKPDNILVARDGTPKLLDFGVAKIVSEDAPPVDDTPGMAATWLMTPDYASPEQVAGATITTASDVYSLGVLLHVLLTGTRPYHLTGTTPAAIQQEFRATTLMPPSARAIAAHADRDARAARRDTTSRQLSTRLAGDLDAIIARALSRDVTARYSTVEQLADDLERHRTRHPVVARGDDLPYRAARFVRRHVLALGVAAGMSLLAAGGVAAVLWQAAIAAEARARAERRFDDVRRLASAFMFDVHDEIVNVPGSTPARALIVGTTVKYLDSLAREAADDLGLQRELASAYVRVGDAQGLPTNPNIGDTAGALASYRRAIAIATDVRRMAPGDLEAARTLALAHRRLGDVLSWAGDLPAALVDSERSLALFLEVAAHAGATVEDRLQAGIAHIKLGDLVGNPNFPNLGRAADAAREYQVALDLLRRLDASAPDHAQVRRYVGLTLERVGTLHEAARRWPEATTAYRESFEIRRALAEREPLHNNIQRDLAIAYEKLGNVQRVAAHPADAVASYRAALAQFTRLAQADPSNTNAARTVAISREKLAETIEEIGGGDEAASLLRDALATHRTLAARDPDNAQARCEAGRVAERLGDATARWPAPAGGPAACASWRESLETRELIRSAGRRTCVSDEDMARLAGKLAGCR
jgi:serine/threonine protein kinase/tetratricopeptide (TPR) repeat protein